MSKIFVRCRVLPGLFDGEFYVLVNGSSSAYVIRDNVRLTGAPRHGMEVDGEVLAYVINQTEERSLVEVAGDPVVGGLRTWVPNSMLASA